MTQDQFEELVLEAKTWLARGVCDQDEIFRYMQEPRRRIHYSVLRKAIHEAKVGA